MRYLAFSILALLIPGSVLAQDTVNCQRDDFFRGLRQGQTLVVPCDSMVLLTKPTYERLSIEAAQQEDVIDLSTRANAQLLRMVATQDSLILVQHQDIAALERHDSTLHAISLQLGDRLEASIQNTEAAIGIARRNRVLGILLGGTLGFAVGVLVGGFAL